MGAGVSVEVGVEVTTTTFGVGVAISRVTNTSWVTRIISGVRVGGVPVGRILQATIMDINMMPRKFRRGFMRVSTLESLYEKWD